MNKNLLKNPLKLGLIIGGAVVAVVLAVILISANKDERKGTDWATVTPGQTQAQVEENNGTGNEGETTGAEGNPEEGNNTVVEQTQQNAGVIPTLGDEEPYEDWLVSAMIIGVSMQYSDFEFIGIYTASETAVSDHGNSAGAYLIFNGDGQKLALKAVPLAGERGDRGTADLYVPAIGYATYELVDVASVPVATLKERKIEDLADLISASSQVSIIER